MLEILNTKYKIKNTKLQNFKICKNVHNVLLLNIRIFHTFFVFLQDSTVPGAKDSVWNRCLFQCALCSATFTDRRNMKSHTVQGHSLTYSEYIQQNGDPEVHLLH